MDPELRIIELEEEIELLKHDLKNQQNVNFEWSGSLGKWEWYIAENRVVFNDKKIQALGYNRNDLPEEIGYSFFTEKIHPDDYEQTMENMRQHLYGQSPAYETEYRIRHKDGHWIWFYDRGVVYKRDKYGKPIDLIGIVFDISKRKQIEEDIIAKNNELTISNANKDRLISIIGHDLRVPLSTLYSMLQIVNENHNYEEMEQQGYFKTMEKSAQNLYELTTNLLEWAYNQRNKQAFNPEYFDINEIALFATDVHRDMAIKKSINLNVVFKAKGEVYADKQMVSTIIRNLISNAIKFTNRGGNVTLLDEVYDNYIKIIVKDSGIGMSEEQISDLLNFNTKNKQLGTEGEPGTGLGLILCKEFVGLNGGVFDIKSSRGVGTEISFTLKF